MVAKRVFPVPTKEALLRYIEDGKTQREVGKQHGCTATTVQRWEKMHGISRQQEALKYSAKGVVIVFLSEDDPLIPTAIQDFDRVMLNLVEPHKCWACGKSLNQEGLEEVCPSPKFLDYYFD